MSVPAPGSRQPLRVTEAGTVDEIAPFADSWDALAERAPQGLVTLSHAWISSHLEHLLEPEEDWRVFLAHEGDDLVGVLPLVRIPHGALRLTRPWLHVPSSLHTRHGDPLLAAARPAETLSALLSSARTWEPRLFSVDIGSVRDASPTRSVFLGRLPGWACIDRFDQMGSLVLIRGTYAEFTQHLPRNFRRNLKKARNRLAKIPRSGAWFLGPRDDVGTALERFLEVEASGWKGAAGTRTAWACLPQRRAFMGAVVGRLRARGWIEFHFLEIDGTTAAAHFAVRVGRRLTLLRIGYDERFSRFAPGNVLLSHLLEREFDSGASDVVDCLTDMTWHRNWAMTSVPYRSVAVFPRRPASMLLGALPLWTWQRLKRWPRLAAWVRRLRP